MEYNKFIFFSIAGLTNILLIIISFFKRRRKEDKRENLYGFIILTTSVTIILEILMCFFIKNVSILKYLPKIHIVLSVLWTSLLGLYIIYTIKDGIKERRVWTLIMLGMFLLFSIIVCIMPLENVYNSTDVTLLYTKGLANDIALMYVLFTVLIALITILLSKKSITNKKYSPIYLYMVFCSIIGIIKIYYPEVLLISFIESIVITYMYIIMESPDIKKLSETTILKELAENNDKAKTNFLANMSHEIRTPLNAIYGLSEDNLVFKDTLPKDVVENCMDIMSASNNLIEIVGNILDINKIENNDIQITDAPYNFVEEINELCKIVAARIGNKSIEFKLDIDKRMPEQLLGDKVLVKKIINNILTNAIKFTERGEVNLTIKVNIEKNIAKLNIVCRDTGRGIRKDELANIFNEFERVSEERIGSGLGLSITKSLLDLMGGTIRVDSTFGVGSTFIVDIPQKVYKDTPIVKEMDYSNEFNSNTIKEDNNEEKETIHNETLDSEEEIDLTKEEEVEEIEDQEELETISINFTDDSKKNELVADYGNKRILIVDDNYSNVKVAKRALRGFNVDIDECYDGKECLNKIDNGEKYDLILMDIMMPNLSGTKTLERLKEDPNFDTPVVALTADALAGSREKYLSQGFNDYLAKPVSKEEMKKTLDKILKKA